MGRLLFLGVFFHLLIVSSAFEVEYPREDWQCGADKFEFTKTLAYLYAGKCHGAALDRANLCCKVHDHCYDNHLRTGATRTECDENFCRCLQDGSDKTKTECNLDQFCARVKEIPVYGGSVYVDHSPEFVNFVDKKPLGMDFKALIDSCVTNKRVVGHCHNTIRRCMSQDHERDKREMSEAEWEEQVKHSYQDCRTTVHDCLRKVIDTSDSVGLAPSEKALQDQCVVLAKSMQETVRKRYGELMEKEVGKAIIEAYAVPAARLLDECPHNADKLRQCYLDFDNCFKENPLEHQTEESGHLYNSPTRIIRITCHRTLSKCINVATEQEITEKKYCLEARDLAISFIRRTELTLVEPNGVIKGVADTVDVVVEGVKTGVQGVKDGVTWVGNKIEAGVKWVGDAKDSTVKWFKDGWNSVIG